MPKKTAEELRKRAKELLEKARELERERARRIGELVMKYERKNFEGFELEKFVQEIKELL